MKPKPMQVRLNRTTFQTSRLLDFCSEKELTAQTGHEREVWPLVALKELMDNALDACEEAGVAPDVQVTVDGDGITVADNGLGIPTDTVDGILDFTVRTSSREAYVSPTRGAQGNAMKTVIAMPFVLDGEHGRVDIGAHGQRHEIAFSVDRVAQRPQVAKHSVPDQFVKTGTSVKLWWPPKARLELQKRSEGFLQLADSYTWLNPHLTLAVDWYGKKTTVTATDPAWRKWAPSDPTSAHWYGREELERLVGAYVVDDQAHGRERLVREFVAEFRGLSGSAKQKVVLEETGLSRRPLAALINGNGFHHDIIEGLLLTMRRHSAAVKPEMLGAIGKQHLVKRFADLGCFADSFTYKQTAESDEGGLPELLEVAFAWRGEGSEESRHIIPGVNWSPGIGNPFRSLGTGCGDGLAAALEKRRAGRDEPIILVIHLASPRVRYTDRGKTALVIK